MNCLKKEKKIQPKTIITSHTNADFDAIASMLAAQKLYPEALVIFPGSQEKTSEIFLSAPWATFLTWKTQKHRLFPDPKVDRCGYPQPPSHSRRCRTSGKKGWKSTSMTTIQIPRRISVQILVLSNPPVPRLPFNPANAGKNIAISPEEATVMALGIYEDTGSFTYTSTTEADLQAAAFFLSCGPILTPSPILSPRRSTPTRWPGSMSFLMKKFPTPSTGWKFIFPPSPLRSIFLIWQPLYKW